MLFKSGDVKAMERFASWYSGASRSTAAVFLPAKPAPAFLFSTSSAYVLMVTARAGEYVLVIDDNDDPGSIPHEQQLGPTGEQPGTVVERALDTTLWFAGQQLDAGEFARGEWYLETYLHVARQLGLAERADTADTRLFEHFARRSEVDPERYARRLGLYGQQFKAAGAPSRAAVARFLEGNAIELAIRAGGTRFTPADAEIAYELALDAVPEEHHHRIECLGEAKARLRALRA